MAQHGDVLYAAAPGLVQWRLLLPGIEYLHLVGEDGAEEELPGALPLPGCRYIGKDLLPEDVGEDSAHADVTAPNPFIGEREVAFRGEPPPMPGWPAPPGARS